MPQEDVLIPTADGRARGTLHVPGSGGPWPGVVIFPDAGGFRETFREMGQHLAGLGYVALVPDVYYREGEWAPFDMATAFSDEKERARLFGVMGSLTNELPGTRPPETRTKTSSYGTRSGRRTSSGWRTGR
jgi:carboxymethylenebutenolidase